MNDAREVSTDLTFITNERGRTLADRFRVRLSSNTRDCLVGYYYLSGFKVLADALEPAERVRILIGLSTDQPTYDLVREFEGQMRLSIRSHAETKEEVPAAILAELKSVTPPSCFENLVAPPLAK